LLPVLAALAFPKLVLLLPPLLGPNGSMLPPRSPCPNPLGWLLEAAEAAAEGMADAPNPLVFLPNWELLGMPGAW